jgi:hypothetical protein
LSAAGCHTKARRFKFLKNMPNCHYRAVTPDWMGSIASENISWCVFFKGGEPYEDIILRLFFMYINERVSNVHDV